MRNAYAIDFWFKYEVCAKKNEFKWLNLPFWHEERTNRVGMAP
jgi:hypothetical protein